MRIEDSVRIRHMIEAAESIAEFVAGRNRSELDTNRMLLFAVVRAIEVLGEAASKVSDETRDASGAIPWKAIIGMRNRLIHAYFDVNAQLVRESATVEIPAIVPKLRLLVASV